MKFSKKAILNRYSLLTFNDMVEEYYKGSGFLNFGLWKDGVIDQVSACEQLMDSLIARLNRNGRILDVACGKGATTKYLLKTWDASMVDAINISEVQLEIARQRSGSCRFYNMSATDLSFAEDTFDDIICVEAAFHFETRKAFFREAYRVLKDGGKIALTDLLMPWWAWYFSNRVPSANRINDLTAYRTIMESIGFKAVNIHDITADSLPPFFSYLTNWINTKFKERRIQLKEMIRFKIFWGIQKRAFNKYILVSAQK